MNRQQTTRAPAAKQRGNFPAGILQRKCACGQHSMGEQCDECKKKHSTLQRSSVGTAAPSIAPPVVHEALRTPGQPLDAGTRNFMESRFGHDFSQVSVHTDTGAAESARAVDAEAYTVGQDIVFGAGRFQPWASAGQNLLAHELTHVVQQNSGPTSSGFQIDPDPQLEAQAAAAADGLAARPSSLRGGAAVGPSLQRQPVSGRKSSGPPKPFITDILVDQNSTQRVTANFSDGTSVGDECSTGKGHCCFDKTSGTAEGGACSASRSTQTNNNCTPVGTFTVTAQLPVTPGGVKLWTQFHDAKQVALHRYSPVDGTPLSHGCVRLHEPMAQTIFDHARVGVTKVKVQGLARPECDSAKLQAEWEGDYADAGKTPPDGSTPNPATQKPWTKQELALERHIISEARTDLRSALGVDESGLNTELASWTASQSAGGSIGARIPRCVPTLTKEEKQSPAAQGAGVVGAGASTTAAAFSAALARAGTPAAAERTVKQFGEKLWQASTVVARGGGAGTDDRQLYWTRLMLTERLRQWDPLWPNTTADSTRRLHARLLDLLEQTSRGMTTAMFPSDPKIKRILISGFDPFGFPNQGDIRQSNLSGAAALALDGETLTAGAVSARVEAVVYPVRYGDFDAAIVEKFLRPQLSSSTPPDLVMSISQGDKQFELEEWAGRRRSAAGFKDDLGVLGGGTPTAPLEPADLPAGPEFLRTSVPAATLGSMRSALGRKSAIREETEVQDLPSGAKKVRTLPKGPVSLASKSVEGSGGGFLSNEIFYRNSLLRTQSGSNVPMIHLHTPMLAPGASDAERNKLIGTIRNVLNAALPHL